MDLAFGTKLYDTKKKQIGILIRTYNLGYVDAPDATGAHVISTDGKKYPQNLDNLIPISDMTDEEIAASNIPQCFINN